MIELSDIAIAVISAISSGGLSFWVAIKSSRRDDFSIIIAVIKEDNERLRQRVVELEKKFEELEKKYDKEKERANLLELEVSELRSEIDS